MDCPFSVPVSTKSLVTLVGDAKAKGLEFWKSFRKLLTCQDRCRENLQTPLDIKRKRSDHIVENNSDINTLRERVASVYHQIVSPQ